MKKFDSIQIISGGQTGIDQLGLFLAKTMGLVTGGLLPLQCRTETGYEFALRHMYNMDEASQTNYAHRTRINVENSNLVLIFGDTSSKGTAQTIDFCEVTGTIWLDNPNEIAIRKAIAEINKEFDDLVINVAGNRASKLHPTTLIETTSKLVSIFKWLKDEKYLQYTQETLF